MKKNLLKKWKVPALFFLLLALSGIEGIAQSLTVSGRVTAAEDSQPLPGVNVVLKGTTQGTVTDADGNYSLKVGDQTQRLVFSFIGYLAEEVIVSNRTVIDVQLTTDFLQLDEIVVVGYGQTRKSDLTGAISSIQGSDIPTAANQNAVQALQGKVTGVQVTSTSGEPGAAARVLIRGTGTTGDANPLYVVDGVLLRNAEDINYLNSSDIESIEILKDASSAAIYGARGANGVIIITTKTGQSGAPKVNVELSNGWQYVPDKIDLLDGPQFAQLFNEIDPTAFPDPNNVSNIDWQDRIIDDGATIFNANVSVSGGNELAKYYVSFGYFNQEGIIPTSQFERYTLRINNTYNVHEKFKVGHNLTFTRTVNNIAPNLIPTIYRARPTELDFNPDGTFAPHRVTGNPLAQLEFNNNRTNGFQSVGNIFAEYNFLNDFTVRSSIGISANLSDNEVFNPVFSVDDTQQNLVSRLSVNKFEDIRWFWENTVSYNKEFDVHRISAVAGFTMQADRSENVFASVPNLIREDPTGRFLDNGAEDENNPVQVGGNAVESSIVSFLFRGNYTYNDRYLLTLTARTDASSVFPEGDRYAFFPAIGVGWNVSEESFLQSNLISNLKLRASWGILGNDRIPNETRFSVISPQPAVFGPDEQLIPGAALGNIANSNIKWERTTTYDIGVEISLFDGRLNGEIDYYHRRSEDLLTGLQVGGFQGNGGFTNVTFNTATVDNKGFEFNINWRETIGDFTYGIGFLGTTLDNEVKELGAETGNNSFITNGSLGNGDNVTRTEVGRPIGSFYGFKVIGVFQDQDEVDNNASIGGQGVGDLRYADLEPDGVINDLDRTFIGSPIPEFLYGMDLNVGYKNIDLSFAFQGQSGNDIFNGKQLVRPEIYNFESRWLDRWTPENPSNSVPRASAGGPNFDPSDFYVEDGSFFRLRTVTLGYTLPSAITGNIGIERARFYASGTNVFTSSDYSGYTPEIAGGSVLSNGIDLGVYPITAVYSLGLNVTF